MPRVQPSWDVREVESEHDGGAWSRLSESDHFA
jgi:hypothetical protein